MGEAMGAGPVPPVGFAVVDAVTGQGQLCPRHPDTGDDLGTEHADDRGRRFEQCVPLPGDDLRRPGDQRGVRHGPRRPGWSGWSGQSGRTRVPGVPGVPGAGWGRLGWRPIGPVGRAFPARTGYTGTRGGPNRRRSERPRGPGSDDADVIGGPVEVESQRGEVERLVRRQVIGVGRVVFALPQLPQRSFRPAGGERRRRADEMAFRGRRGRIAEGHTRGLDAVLFVQQERYQEPG